MIADAGGELRKSLVNEIVADVHAASTHPRVLGSLQNALPGKVEGGLRHLRFGAVGVKGDFCDALAVEFTALEVHQSVTTCGILAKRCVEDNEWLDEVDPVGVTEALEALEANGEQRNICSVKRAQ